MKSFLSYAIITGSILTFNEAAVSMDEENTPPKKVLFRKSKLFQEDRDYQVTGKQIKKIINNIDGEIGDNEDNSTAVFDRYDSDEDTFSIGVCALNLDPSKLSDSRWYTFRWRPNPPDAEPEDGFIRPCAYEAEPADEPYLSGIWVCLGVDEDREPFMLGLNPEY